MPPKKKTQQIVSSDKRETAPVQVRRDLAKMLVVIAAHRDVKIADVLDPVIRQRNQRERQDR